MNDNPVLISNDEMLFKQCCAELRQMAARESQNGKLFADEMILSIPRETYKTLISAYVRTFNSGKFKEATPEGAASDGGS